MADLRITLYCAECGKELNDHDVTRNKSGDFEIEVEHCTTCMDAKYEQGMKDAD